MLKRIKVRSKLLLLVVTPLVALGAFAAVGVEERLERSEFFGREARLADLADAGADIALAVQVEQNQALQVAAGGDADLELAIAASDTAVQRWLDVAAVARPDLSPAVVAQVDAFEALLGEARRNSSDSSMALVAEQLLTVGRSINAVTIGLTTEARDLELYRALGDYLQLSRVQLGIAEITAIGARAIENGDLGASDLALLRAAGITIEDGLQQFADLADDPYVDRLDQLSASGVMAVTGPGSGDPSDRIVEVQEFVNRADDSAALDWLVLGEERLTATHDVSSALLQAASASAHDTAATAGDEARDFLILAGVVIIAALILAVFVSRSIASPLRGLTVTAERLASEELPALVEGMRQGTASPAVGLTPIDTKGRDEVAQLARAVSDIQNVTVAVAEEQGDLLRRGISDMFVNLARRNQSLLDRQIDFIDQLESREENPDVLENLFRLDHLATRMRRNAESLLVLAGVESSTRRRGNAVELVDVVRVAMGEIEDFSRIRLLSISPATVAGSVAVDLAHLLSELMENATQFSPPESPVEVVGQRTEEGAYVLSVSDQGIGLSAEQLIEANHTLANPPVIGLELGRTLGFTVVSRLAHRLGITVRLSTSPHGGVTAIVTIPAEMTGDLHSPEPVRETPDALHAAGLQAASSEPIGLPDGTVAGLSPVELTPAAEAAPVEAAQDLGSSDPLFDLGRSGGMPGFEQAGPAGPARSVGSRSDMFGVFGDPPATTPTDEDLLAPLGQDDDHREGTGSLPQRRPRAGAPDDAASPPESSGPGSGDSQGEATPRAASSSLPPPPGIPPDLPRRRPEPDASSATPVVPTAPSPARIVESAPPTASTAPEPDQQAVPRSPDPDRAAAPAASAATIGAVDPAVTSAGLIRRTPRPPESENQTEAPRPAVRSPEEVRQMLSRYRTGLRKGREAPPT